jgi:hypothetical protein
MLGPTIHRVIEIAWEAIGPLGALGVLLGIVLTAAAIGTQPELAHGMQLILILTGAFVGGIAGAIATAVSDWVRREIESRSNK